MPSLQVDTPTSAPDRLDDDEAEELAAAFEGQDPRVLLEWALARFSPRVALCTAFQLDGVALLDMAYRIDPAIQVVSVDTGRLPRETLDFIETLRGRYPRLNLSLLSPQEDEVERMVRAHGADLFRESVPLRLLCCQVRKVTPLGRYLASLDAWITGLRRDQAATRTSVRRIELDPGHDGIVKLNPLADWTAEQVWDYVREHDVPYHPLYDRGYRSIGCYPCTRPVASEEADRAGRWWWEGSVPKECGLHCLIDDGRVPDGASLRASARGVAAR